MCEITLATSATFDLEVRCRDNPQCRDTTTVRIEVGSGPVAVLAPLPRMCPGETIVLDAAASSPSGCPGALEYRFLESTTVLRDWAASATRGPFAPAATTTYTVEVRCAPAPDCVARASETAVIEPAVRPGDLGNTLLHVRRGTVVEESWQGVADARTCALYRHAVRGAWPTPALRTGLSQPRNSEPDVVGPPNLFYYRVAGVGCGGLEGP